MLCPASATGPFPLLKRATAHRLLLESPHTDAGKGRCKPRGRKDIRLTRRPTEPLDYPAPRGRLAQLVTARASHTPSAHPPKTARNVTQNVTGRGRGQAVIQRTPPRTGTSRGVATAGPVVGSPSAA